MSDPVFFCERCGIPVLEPWEHVEAVHLDDDDDVVGTEDSISHFINSHISDSSGIKDFLEDQALEMMRERRRAQLEVAHLGYLRSIREGY